jgi:hypothetical protein
LLGLHRFDLLGRADGIEGDATRPLQQGDGRRNREPRLAAILPRDQGGLADGVAQAGRRRHQHRPAAAHQHVRDVWRVIGGSGVAPAEDDQIRRPGGAGTGLAGKSHMAAPVRLEVPRRDDGLESRVGAGDFGLGHVAIEGEQLPDHGPAAHRIVQRRRDRADAQAGQAGAEGVGEVAGELKAAVALGSVVDGDEEAGVGHGGSPVRAEETALRGPPP